MGTNSTLVPSDLPLVRFNTRAIITRYRYNGASLSRVSVFRVHVHAHARNLCHCREVVACRERERDENEEGYPFPLLLFHLRWISRSRIVRAIIVPLSRIFEGRKDRGYLKATR